MRALSLSWRAIASLKIFQSADARMLVLEHFGLKTQHIAADNFLPAIFTFFK
jgi:ribonuclease BN (tRNA processing enzyme)